MFWAVIVLSFHFRVEINIFLVFDKYSYTAVGYFVVPSF
jgi:hypothetical protein